MVTSFWGDEELHRRGTFGPSSELVLVAELERAEGDGERPIARVAFMTQKADFSPAPPRIGADNMRYNRIEGLSFGGKVDQELGAGSSTSFQPLSAD